MSQITPTGTTCREFARGTAETLSNLNYSVDGGKVKNNVTPGVFFYWVSVTVPPGNNVFTITETITTANFTGKFNLDRCHHSDGNRSRLIGPDRILRPFRVTAVPGQSVPIAVGRACWKRHGRLR